MTIEEFRESRSTFSPAERLEDHEANYITIVSVEADKVAYKAMTKFLRSRKYAALAKRVGRAEIVYDRLESERLDMLDYATNVVYTEAVKEFFNIKKEIV